jgi:LPXTG-motif cell wall-anchored protein
MIRKTMAAGLVVMGFMAMAFVMGPTADAQEYLGCQAVLSDTTPDPGQTVTVSGTGAAAGDTVTARLNGSTIGSGTADSGGSFSFPATIPAGTAAGTATVNVDCGPNGGVAGVTITVSAARGGGGVATTGSNSTLPLTKLGLSLVVVGGLFVAFSRRRRVANRETVSS